MTRKSKDTSDKRERRGLGLTPKRAEMFGVLIRTFIGGVIGLALTTLFFLVIVAVVATGITRESQEGIQLLNTALTVVGSALGAVLGYFLGRGSKSQSN